MVAWCRSIAYSSAVLPTCSPHAVRDSRCTHAERLVIWYHCDRFSSSEQ